MCNHIVMNSNTDLSEKADTPLIEKRSNHSWKIIFIILLVFNLIYLGKWLLFGSGSSGNILPAFDFIGLLTSLGIINLVAVLSYIIAQHPHGGPQGIARIISDTVLIAAIFAMMPAGIIVYTILHGLSQFH